MGFSRILTHLSTTSSKPLPSAPPLLRSLIHSSSSLKDQFFSNKLPCEEQNTTFGFTPAKVTHHAFHPAIAIPRFLRRSIHGPLMNAQVIGETEEPNSEKICKLLSILPNSSCIESALESCGVEQVTPVLVVEVLKKLSNAGFVALGVFKWAEKQKGFKHTAESYNALIDSLGKIKQFKMIWLLVDSMKSKGLLNKDTFMLIIRRYARAKRVEEANQAFEKMEGLLGMKLDLSDINRFLDTLCKSRQVGFAHQLFDKMKKTGFVPDKKSYAILLEGWGQQQNLLKLEEVFREMKDEGFEPDVVAYGIIMNAYFKARKTDKALERFREMEAKAVKPSAHIYCILINGLGSEKRLGEALKFFEMSKATGVTPEAPTYNAVVGSYCWSRRFDEAFRVVDEMRRCGVGPNARTYDIILHHLIKAGKTEEAYSVFQRMSNEQGCDPTVSTYEIVVRMFCNNGRLDMAIQVWDQMKGKGFLPGMHMFATLINSLCHGNKLEDACKYFQEMLDVGIRPAGSTFSNLKRALLEAGKKETVKDLARKLDVIRTTPVIG